MLSVPPRLGAAPSNPDLTQSRATPPPIRHFGYDYEAYGEAQRNLTRSIHLGELRSAMEASLEWMTAGSHQVEMSDEVLMTDDIRDCLMPSVQALQKRDLPPGDVLAWCEARAKNDCAGLIRQEPLQKLRKHFAAPPW